MRSGRNPLGVDPGPSERDPAFKIPSGGHGSAFDRTAVFHFQTTSELFRRGLLEHRRRVVGSFLVRRTKEADGHDLWCALPACCPGNRLSGLVVQ